MITKCSDKLESIDRKFTLKDNELHIWRTKISRNKYNIDYYWNLLTQEEQVHASRFYAIEDKDRYVVSRAILRKLIASYYTDIILPKSVLFEYTEYGKPYLSAENNVKEIKFNIAHSKDAIVYAFTKNIEVGIDIEFINTNFVIEDIIKYCCSLREQSYLQNLPNNQKHYYFYKLWVVKEALIKAMGLGLSYDIRQIHINLGKNKLIDSIDIVNNNQIYWTVNMFVSYDGYYSAFATEKPIKKSIFSF